MFCLVPDSYLLLITTTSAHRLIHNSTTGFLRDVSGKEISFPGGGTAIDYDARNGNIYYTNVVQRTLMQWNSTKSLAKTVVHGVGVTDGIAVDWTSDLIYYTDTTYNVLAVVHISGTPKKAVIHSLDEPRAIAIDPENA